MRSSLAHEDLGRYVTALLGQYLPDGYQPEQSIAALLPRTMERVEYCFSHIVRKYYREGENVLFDHMNGDHMAAFLWFLGNTAWRDADDVSLATRLSYLNKIMHGVDLFYSVPMPDIFLLVHPVGTVLGRAQYSDFLVVYQNCTVGAETTVYPRFGPGTILYSRSSVIGDCDVGADTVFAANSFVLNTNVPRDTVVVGQYPRHRFLPNRRPVRDRCFAVSPPIAVSGAS